MVDGGARMGALRRAGVWLGLVEDEDERGYDDRGYRGYGDDFGDEEEDDVDDVPVTPRARMGSDRLSSHALAERSAERLAERNADRGLDRALDRGLDRGHERTGDRGSDRLTSDRLSERLSDRLAERSDTTAATRSTVRSITRPASSTMSYPVRDNLAIAPQLQARETPAVVEDSDDRRYQITTLHPTTYNEARTIGEHFRDGVPVIMNLTEMDESDAKRLVDFAAGLVFGLRGNFERVTNRVFLLSPANVQVTAEDKAKIAEGGFFNQS
jgi:cell division inhibitor SepF